MLYNKNIKIRNKNDSSSILFGMVKNNSIVLDMGCACGDLAEQLVKLKNCTVYGVEYNVESIKKCISKNIFSEITQFDLNNLTKTSFPNYINKFDYIIFGDILEHLLSPNKVLETSLQYLKGTNKTGPKGNILISLPNLSHASIKANLLLNDFTRTPLGILDKTHLHFFTYKTIAQLLSDTKLNVNCIDYTTLPFDGYQPHKLSELPKEINKFITNDVHSSIFQYVLSCTPDQNVSVSSLQKKLSALNASMNAKQNTTYKIKRFIMTKYPQIIKYLEKLR